MAAVEPAASGELLSERVAGGILPRVLNSFDMVAIFVAGFCAWWPGVLVMVATGTITLAFLGYVFPGTVGSWSIQAQGVLIIAFILLSAVLAILRFRLTQNIVNTVFVLYS